MCCSWKGKRTKELDRLYEEYGDIFDRYPDGYLELEGCYNISYEEYVGYLKECIKEKRALPYIMFPEYFLTEEEWEIGNKLYQEYVAVFGKLPKYIKDIEGYETVTEEFMDSVGFEDYIMECIAKKKKTPLSDVLMLNLEEMLYEYE